MSAALDARDLPTDDIFGNYIPLSVLGEGGMGIVYLAEQTAPFSRMVALKVLKPGLMAAGVAERFERERQSLGRMDHPHIAAIYDAGASARGVPWFSMEYVEGSSITTHCDEANLDLAGRISLFLQVCAAVDHAHKRGILHRDIKPGNILVTVKEGQALVKVIDFGLARLQDWHVFARQQLTGTAQILGTPEYMSPEQAAGPEAAAGPCTDVYALGVMLYELLAGVLPFEEAQWGDRGIADVLRVICELEPPSLSRRFQNAGSRREAIARARGTHPRALQNELKGDLEAIVRKCLEKAPSRRYTSASMLVDDLQRYRNQQPVEARRGDRVYRTRKWVRRNRAKLMWSITPAALAAAGAIAIANRPQSAVAIASMVPYTATEGYEIMPSFSPDGKSIVYVWNGPQGDNYDLYLARSPGEPPRRLTTDLADDVSPAWSPDGASIAFLRGSKPNQSRLMLLDVTTGQERELTELHAWYTPHTRNLAWSPDGRWLAVLDNDAGRRFGFPRLYSPQSGETRRIMDLPDDAEYLHPAFSPDGRDLIFVRDDLQVNTTFVQHLTPDYRAAGAPVKIDTGQYGLYPAFLPQGDVLCQFEKEGQWRIWRRRATGGEMVPLEQFGDDVHSFAISRDGSRVAVVKRRLDADLLHYRMGGLRVENRPTTVASSTFDDYNPAISPDGGRVAFISNRSGRPQLWVAKTDGTDLRQLTFGDFVGRAPVWLADGRTIRFGTRAGRARRAFLVDAVSGRTTFERSDIFIESATADGRTLFFRKALGDQEKLYRSPAGSTRVPAAATGRPAFYTKFDTARGWIYYLDQPSGNATLWRTAMMGDRPDEAVEHDVSATGFGLASDGIYYLRQHTKKVYGAYFLSLSNRRTRLLFEIDKRPHLGVSASPDGRDLILAVLAREGTDIWVADVAHW
ncbi:MAG: LpqB family beta-propeller domain-containing protein [Bryobacteraceae bacterium]